ncbi:MAG: response regulator [Ignavibacteriales bacterium]|nr:response regulator [Ignavibacteriales bacterium]
MDTKQNKILVVEDSDDLRENIISLLEINDYDVIVAENGYDGLQLAIKEIPDLIISDRMMPIMEGTQMLQELRNNSITSNIPFIFLTAKSSKADIRDGMNYGADDYLPKPFEANDLLTAVKTRLTKKIKTDEILNKVYKNISQSIPHELRTPLVSIQGFTNIIIDEIETIDRDTIKDMSMMIKNASIRLHRTIEKFILFTEAELMLKDRKSYARISTGLTKIDKTAIELFIDNKTKNSETKHAFELNVNECSVKIWDEHFKVVLNELIDNAVKFSFPDKQIEICSKENDDTYSLIIKNYGRGMTEEEINNASPFIQHNRNYYEQQGNGLGLAITQRIADFYNVKLEMHSVKDSYLEAVLTFKKAVQLNSYPQYPNQNFVVI